MNATANPLALKIPIKTIDGTVFKHPHEIIYFEAEQCWCKVYLSSQAEAVRSTTPISGYKKILCGSFFSCHRSYIINLEHIEKLEKDNRTIHLTGGHIVRVAGAYVDEFQKRTNPL